jgi:hypothetical protein
MKKVSVLFLSLLVISCSKKDEPDPDLTKPFIGLWKTEIQKSARDDIWSTYEIKRVSNDLVRVDVKQYFDAHQGDYEDYADVYTFDSVKVESNEALRIKDSRVYGPNRISYDGKGLVNGNNLTLELIIDYDDQHYNNMFTIPLTKQ